MNYGEYIDENWKNDEFYDIINSYYNNPTMTKNNDQEYYSIYMCKLHSLLSVEKRYIIAIVPKDNNPEGHKIPLDGMKWESFQTRTLDNRDIPPHKYSVKKSDKYMIPIHENRKDDNAVYYTCDNYPVIVTLLYTKNTRRYQPEGSLVNALETFNTIITFKIENME